MWPLPENFQRNFYGSRTVLRAGGWPGQKPQRACPSWEGTSLRGTPFGLCPGQPARS